MIIDLSDNVPLSGQDSREWFITYCKMVETDALGVHKLLMNNDYMDWLLEFTLKYPSFISYSLLNENELTKEDIENVKSLRYLMGAIRAYADKNYIAAESEGKDYTYFIRYKGVVFKIGGIVTDKVTFYCARINLNVDDKAIMEFSSIQKDKMEIHNKNMKVRLSELASLVRLLIYEGIPGETILETTTEAINKSYNKKD